MSVVYTIRYLIRIKLTEMETKPSIVQLISNNPYSAEETAQMLSVTRNDLIGYFFLAFIYGLHRLKRMDCILLV